jgi:hypothetical protein
MLSNDVSYWSGGHGISRDFGPLAVSESFSTDPYNRSLHHLFSLKLGTLVHGQADADIQYENDRIDRRWNVSAGMNSILNERPGFLLSGEVLYSEKDLHILDENENYAEAWTESWADMVPDLGDGTSVRNRNARGRIEFNLNRTPLGANLSFEGSSLASVPQSITQSASTGRIDFPFVLGSIRGVLRNERSYKRSLYHKNYMGKSIEDDIALYGESLADSSALWLSIPVYAIFDPHLESVLDSTVRQDADNTLFKEILALSLQFPERYDPLSLLIPVSFLTQVDRSLEQRLDTKLDVLTLSSSLGFSGTNLFGAMGSTPLFKMYRNDEFRHSLAGIFSFPRSEDPLWRLQAEQNMGFFGFEGAILEAVNTITVGSTGWIESFTLLWTVPENSTILGFLYDFGMSKMAGNDTFPAIKTLAASDYERLRRESLELIIDRTGDYGQFSCILGHESVVRIIGRLNLSAFAKFNISRDEYSEVLSFMLNFGTALTISF